MVRRPFDSSSAPSVPLHVCVCRMRRFSCISLCFPTSEQGGQRSDGLVVCKKARGYLVPAFHVPASTSVRPIVPSRSSAGQSLIATRAWLACRASLHEGGYDYATFLRWRSRALTDGAPTFFVQTQMPPYSRRKRSWGGHYSSTLSPPACLSLAPGR